MACAHLSSDHAERDDGLRGQPFGLAEQTEHDVLVATWLSPRCSAIVLGPPQHVAGPLGEPAQPAGGREVEILGLARHEPLLHRLLGHAHVLPDLGPRCAGPAGLVDEVADEVVGNLAEMDGGLDRVGQMLQRIAVGVLLDHVVIRSSSRTGWGSSVMRQP